MATISYRPEIDGLRAIAILPVILFHASPSWMPGGYIGVDVFFVISGFLITLIIKREVDQGTFSFRGFWARRIRRILPALIIVIIATLAMSSVVVFRPHQQQIGEQALAALLSFANIYFWQKAGDYWGEAAERSPMLHAWSLSVEEQFYLGFPIVVWAICRFRPSLLPGITVFVAVMSLVLFLWGAEYCPVTTFYLLPPRVWELGTGCLLAMSLGPSPLRRSYSTACATAGVAMIIAAYLLVEKPGGGVALAVVGAAAVLAFGNGGPWREALSWKPLVHVGRVSYSLYLWHWPVLVLAKHAGVDWPGPLDKGVLVMVVYALAITTYYLVERPARTRCHIVPVIITSGSVVACVALWLATWPRYYDTSAYDRGMYVVHSCHPDPGYYNQFPIIFGTNLVVNPGWYPGAYCGEGIRVGDSSRTPEVVVFGDSHGCMWSGAIREAIEALGLSGSFFCLDGCSPFMSIPLRREDRGWRMTGEEVMRFDRARLECLKKWKPKIVIIGRLWSNASEAKDLLGFIDAQGSKVLLIEDPPRLTHGNINVTQWLVSRNVMPVAGGVLRLPFIRVAENEGGRAVVRELAGAYHNVQYLETFDLYVDENQAVVANGRDVLYLDDDHVLLDGAQKIVPRLRHKLAHMMAN